MSIRRAARFVRRVIEFFFLIAAIAGVLVAVQMIWHPFDTEVSAVTGWLSAANAYANMDVLSGISIGMIVLAVLVLILPLLMKRVNRSQYWVSTQRGIVASVVFFVTQLLYGWAEGISRFYLIVSMIGVIILSFIIVEVISLLMREDEEVAFRSDILASITSGLISGILLKLIETLVQA